MHGQDLIYNWKSDYSGAGSRSSRDDLCDFLEWTNLTCYLDTVIEAIACNCQHHWTWTYITNMPINDEFKYVFKRRINMHEDWI